MENNDLLLLMQLIKSLEAHVNNFERAYQDMDKEKFEKYKKAILEFQNKIGFLLKNA